MGKLSKRERLSITLEIENNLENYCRVCQVENTYRIDPTCITCPIGVRLRLLGERLITDRPVVTEKTEKPKFSRKGWSEVDDATLLRMRRDGSAFAVIGKALGRSDVSTRMRFRRLEGYYEKRSE